MKGQAKKQRFSFLDLEDSSVLIGSHGDATVHIKGTVNISGIIYCPKYTVTFLISGEGSIAFRGICNRIVVKKMSGSCILDLRDLTCKEMRFESVQDQSKIHTGKTRVISQVNLTGESILHIAERPLITSSFISGQSQIIHALASNTLDQ